MEELDYLYEVCLTALYSSSFVKFAAVLDDNGKLIIAEYKIVIQNYWRADLVSDDNYHHHDDSSYLFYLDYLVPTIKKTRFCTPDSPKKEEQQQEGIHFEIIEIDANIRLAITPLNESKDKYLCIYLETLLASPDEDVISKLNNAII